MHDFGLQIRYMADEQFAFTICMLAALAFVPPNDVIDSFDTLADYSRMVTAKPRHVRLLRSQLYRSV